MGVGVLGAVLWVVLAEPAEWQVIGGRIVMTEFASLGEFPVLLWFAAIGAGLSFVFGLVGQVVARGDWSRAVFFAAGSILASLIAWRLGVVLGPVDPREAAAGLAEGATVPDQLALNSIAPFLAWPIGALAGALAGTAFDRESQDDLAMAATTAPVIETKS